MRSVHNRICVVGAPRSGTTLVQSLLASHSTATSFTESHFFSRHFARVPGFEQTVLTRNPGPRLRDFLLENHENPCDAARWIGLKEKSILRIWPLLPLWTNPVAYRLIQVLDQLCLRRGRTTWIEKTPQHLHHVALIEAAAGGREAVRFVHVVRNGVEVVSSLHAASRNWERPYDVDTCVRRWNTDVRRSLAHLAEPNHVCITYEDLTSRTEPTVKRLFEAVDLAWEPEIFDRYSDMSNGLVTSSEAWKNGTGRKIQPSDTASGALTDEQRARAGQSLRHELLTAITDFSVGNPVQD